MGSWTTLATDVQQYGWDVDIVTTTVIYGTFLPIVEENLSRDIAIVDAFQVTTSGTLTANSQILATPTNLIAPIALRVFIDGTTGTTLEARNTAFLSEYWPTPTKGGDPKYYGINSATTYRVVPTPTATFGYILDYQGKPAALTSTNTTNFYTNWCYGALVAGCMVETARFVQDDRQATMLKFWEMEYQRQVKLINDEQHRKNRDDVQPILVPQENA